MKTIIAFVVVLLINSMSLAQNVGIGETNPTHTLHVTSFVPGDDPIRVSGLNLSNPLTDTSFVMFNNGDGVFKYIPFDNVLNLLIDSITTNPNFVNNLRDSIDTDVDSSSLTGTILNIYENGLQSSVDLANLVNDNDSDPNNEMQDIDSLTISGDTLTVHIENGNSSSVALPSSIPPGAVMAFNLNICPAGWIKADGTGGTPDLRGEFIRGLDDGRGVDLGRTLSSGQSDMLASHSHSVLAARHIGGYTDNGGAPDQRVANSTFNSGATGGSETRPRNVALLYCIKQ